MVTLSRHLPSVSNLRLLYPSPHGVPGIAHHMSESPGLLMSGGSGTCLPVRRESPPDQRDRGPRAETTGCGWWGACFRWIFSLISFSATSKTSRWHSNPPVWRHASTRRVCCVHGVRQARIIPGPQLVPISKGVPPGVTTALRTQE